MPDIDLMGATYPDVPAVTLPSGAATATFYYPDEIDYASSPSSGGNANRANAILYGTVDSTSTATAFTATVEGLTALVDGTCVMLHNGVVTSASGFTVNVNGLGAKKCYNNMTNATQDTTIFNASYTMLFVYSTSLDSGNGGWWIYRGYDGNTNTIGYQLRTNSGNLVASDTGYRYRLWLTSADGSKWVPINTSTSTNATSNRTLNTRPIDPFGPIVYRSTNGTCSAGAGIGATAIWQQYTLNIGYSYMASGFSLTAQDSVYLRCTPQTDGSAVMQDIVQTLPTSKDGKIYIHLGTAYSTTNMELTIEHPVYWHDGTGIRLWTGAESGGGPEPSSTTPAMDGTAAVGTATTYARADHVHPTDTTRADANHTHGNISSVGTIASSAVIEPGDSLVIGHGQSYNVIRSTLMFGSDTATFLRNDGTWAQPEGGGGGGGGGGDAYVIGMTLSGTTVSNVTYPTGESATTIATAVMDDPSTRVVFSIDVGASDGVMNCTPCSLQADAYPAYGDMATSIVAVIPMWYKDGGGDRETYLLRLTLNSGSWYAETRTTI